MKANNLAQIKHIADELNGLAQERKHLVDRIWLLEDTGEKLRLDLMKAIGKL